MILAYTLTGGRMGCNPAPINFIGVILMYSTLRKYAVMAVGALFAFFGVGAYAAVPAAVTTGISDAVTDVSTIGAAILGVVIVIAAFAWMRRIIK